MTDATRVGVGSRDVKKSEPERETEIEEEDSLVSNRISWKGMGAL